MNLNPVVCLMDKISRLQVESWKNDINNTPEPSLEHSSVSQIA